MPALSRIYGKEIKVRSTLFKLTRAIKNKEKEKKVHSRELDYVRRLPFSSLIKMREPLVINTTKAKDGAIILFAAEMNFWGQTDRAVLTFGSGPVECPKTIK